MIPTRWLAAVVAALLLPACNRSPAPAPAVRSETFHVPGMHCSSCVAQIRVKARSIPGVAASRFDLEARTVTLDLSDPSVTRQRLADALAAAGFGPDEPKAAPAPEAQPATPR